MCSTKVATDVSARCEAGRYFFPGAPCTAARGQNILREGSAALRRTGYSTAIRKDAMG